MATLTIRLPDDTHERLKSLAAARNISVNKLFEEFSVTALCEYDTEARFAARAMRGDPAQGMALLDTIESRVKSS